MSNPKIKSEHYQALGGINNKISTYSNSPLEFLDLTNFDFQTPGALTQRWGSTMYFGQTFPGQVNALFEFERLNGSSYVIASHSGGIWFGATTGQNQGVSLSRLGVTFGMDALATSYPPGTAIDRATSSGTTGVNVTQQAVRYKDLPNIFFDTSNGFQIYENPDLLNDNKLSSVVFQDWMFLADGNKFLKFNGSTFYPVGLPPVTGAAGMTAVVLNSFIGTTVGFGNATTGSYGVYASYVNNRGFESNIWPVALIDATQAGGPTLGGSFLVASRNLYTPLAYGISAINLYSYFFSYRIASNGTSFWQPNYQFVSSVPVTGSSIMSVAFGTTASAYQNWVQNNAGALPNPAINTYNTFGTTVLTTSTYPNGIITEYDFTSFYPRFLEIYQNRLFTAGFSLVPSSIKYSDLGEPEGFPLINDFEVRTNDADVITALKAYSNRLMIFKKNSFHALFGDDPNNFYVQELSVIYGCLNNRCVVAFDDFLVFLDRKGIIHYNGSTIDVISNKVQPFFDRMNYNVALNTACMVHDKLRNQILIAIPIDGASSNNITMVYDYMAKAWTTHKGYSSTVFAEIKGYNNTKNAFYGDSSGRVNWFGPSFLADNGSGYTLYFKTRFLHDLGDSTESQYRRLYINADSSGGTYVMPINFFQDYGTSIVYSTTFLLGQFQNRIDYGIAAKSLAFELYNIQTAFPLRVYGFTIESRLQRRV